MEKELSKAEMKRLAEEVGLSKSGKKICNKTCKNDMLKLIWENQIKLDNNIHNNMGVEREETKAKRWVALLCEMGEVLKEDEFYKYWKLTRRIANKEHMEQLQRARKELIDVLHFFISISIDYFDSPEEMFEYYCEKNEINMQRQKDNY